MKGFKDFIMQGNVIDLAVGVVIGGAFTALVTAFSDNIINPVLAAAGGANNVDGLAFRIFADNPATAINIGALITAIITFLITAAVVYFVFVMPVAKARQAARARRGLPAEEESAAPEDVVLLTEIRDLLATQQGGTRI
ncbi:large conductance mechanosensitive channel protein MscL [Brachybacterium sp. JHP9]|uniref:Large-conductance mechanosensitive channel n=1 Tax=Brachybacterium equifaecis TaxID=2910770 RepID=A0ABT0QVY3_9MICO|nr:large conductance mechanosensitive channel protein MscL [Brachybacterium equifaecis]MCL6421814.1 large conductance mechanosensitive channel protein MscL [Brachybacterium equifaecis]